MIKTVLREIKNSLGRYIAIFAIIALGTGFLTGLMVTKPAMTDTLNEYVADTSFYDWRLISTLGYDAENVTELMTLRDVAAAEGSVELDALFSTEDGSDEVLKTHAITENVNRLSLNCGRMPEKPNECVADWLRFDEDDLGKTLRLSPNNDTDTLEKYAYDEYVIVGVATTPSYINFERGNTSLGTGAVAGYVYIPYSGYDVDYYTDIYIKLKQTAGVYTDEYDDLADATEAEITEMAERCAQERYERVVGDANAELDDAQKEYDDAYAEYLDGLDEYDAKKADTQQELDDALKELTDGEKEISDGWGDYHQGHIDLETETTDAQKKLDDAQKKLDDALKELADGEKDYNDGKAELLDGEKDYAEGEAKLQDGEAEYADGKEQYEDGLRQYEDGASQLAEAEAELESALEKILESADELNAAKSLLDEKQALFDASLEQVTAGVNAYMEAVTGQAGAYSPEDVLSAIENGDPTMTAIVDAALAPAGSSASALVYGAGELRGGWAEYEQGREELEAGEREYNEGENEYLEGLAELNASKGQLDDAKAELKEARRELDDGWAELKDARRELDDGWAELKDARQELDDGWREYDDGVKEYEDGKQELKDETEKAKQELDDAYAELRDAEKEVSDGWGEYYDGKTEADEKFSDAEEELLDAEKKLADAKKELLDARDEIDDIEKPTVYVLGRNANVGYVCFESDTDIVAGIANVFPVFFFLVAALVCITTMTRMVDEQRTQIGVYKALGFSASTIMGKYMLYSGSASLLGCVLGFFGGSYLFPKIIWKAYCMMYGFAEIDYYFDPALGAIATAAYLAVSSLATWLACRGELKDVPAELIRPKTQKAGKRIFLERFPFIWKRVGFLHKVSIRNIIRYRQRMLMMVIGIGGCTALLLTGYGIRDSIKNVVNFQYDEISLYEYTAVFADAQTGSRLPELLGDSLNDLEEYQLVYEGSMDVEVDGKVKSAYVVAPESGELEGLVDLHNGDEKLPYPKAGEALICTNLAETYGLKTGDVITVRDSDMRSLTLTVSGIFENYIYNYIYVSADSFTEQWGKLPEMKTLFARPVQGADTGAVAAELLSCDGVNSVSSAQELENRIGTMMSSLDYIVWLIIVCSGALAFIVLYNLTNINITERMREIATIKVLGFYPQEAASYVFRENIVLTAMGAAFGLVLGICLHAYVIAQIQIDMMHFEARIIAPSYFMALAFTFLFAIIVNIVMYFKLERINMAEALKSIE